MSTRSVLSIELGSFLTACSQVNGEDPKWFRPPPTFPFNAWPDHNGWDCAVSSVNQWVIDVWYEDSYSGRQLWSVSEENSSNTNPVRKPICYRYYWFSIIPVPPRRYIPFTLTERPHNSHRISRAMQKVMLMVMLFLHVSYRGMSNMRLIASTNGWKHRWFNFFPITF
jgi:hypothetical protein